VVPPELQLIGGVQTLLGMTAGSLHGHVTGAHVGIGGGIDSFGAHIVIGFD
jgi:hypothetical protein